MRACGRRSAVLVCVTALVTALTTFAAAQSRPAHVFVFATDAAGAPVIDLSAADFSIRENGTAARLLSVRRGTDPIRLVVISNLREATDISAMRRGLKQMLASVPPSAEVALATASGGYASRLAPTSDRARQQSSVNSLRDEGGELAHALMESEGKLFRDQPVRWPIYVIVTDDSSENSSAVKQFEFDAFSDRLSAQATVHAVLLKEGQNSQTGKIVDSLAANLPRNTGGLYQEVSDGRGLADAIAAVGARIAADAQRMADGYELSYEKVAQGLESDLEIGTARPGVTLRPSMRRIP